ncbi:hypothetical protein [Bradyrhizobium sp. I1.14.4]|uniref:hypothetical protein n=1 Tax=unclassified Bradyrhizobium TaxID=2631580 RepID=UPI003D1C6AAC
METRSLNGLSLPLTKCLAHPPLNRDACSSSRKLRIPGQAPSRRAARPEGINAHRLVGSGKFPRHQKVEMGTIPGVNCLIGPGDSTKTTVLDAIELCLNPRSYIFADDRDFFDLDIKAPIRITVTAF